VWWLYIASVIVASVCDVYAMWDRPGKKLVEYGWDVPSPAFVMRHIREMERLPFDGIVLRLRGYDRAFDTKRWDEDGFGGQLEELSGIRWGKFTDNFVLLLSASTMDWFDDGDWRNILHNLRLISKAVRMGRCVGVCFDPEPYGPNPWAYSRAIRRDEKSFREYWEQARRRGAQFMEAISSEVPDIKVLTFFQLSILPDLLDEPDPGVRMERLEHHAYGLLPAFLNGMLDRAGPDVVIIDGDEPAYYYTDELDYLHAYHTIKQRALALIAPENRTKYTAQVQAGFALYVDQIFALRRPRRAFASYYMSPKDRKRWFEHNVYWALSTSDEYVWCYSERMSWWEGRDVPLGAREAIRSARDKVRRGEPLGFSIKGTIEEAEGRLKAELEGRLVRRKAQVRRLGPREVPKVDGRLDDSIWRELKSLGPFLPTASSFKESTEVRTFAWVAYDDDSLYVAFRCEEPRMDEVRAFGSRKDDEIWRGDVVEVFVSAGEEPTPYYHFIVNPKNVQWDGISAERGDDPSWDAEWKSAVALEERGWTVEVAIPWKVVGGPPEEGEVRRANLCRERTPVRELSAWSNTVRLFLEPENFGVWTFGK